MAKPAGISVRVPIPRGRTGAAFVRSVVGSSTLSPPCACLPSLKPENGPTAADEVRYDGNALGFFPAVLGNPSGRIAARGMRLGVDTRYIGRIYLDQTESRSASISPHAIVDANASFGARLAGAGIEFSLRVFNLLDREYETGGYMDYDLDGSLSPRFIPGATRSALAQVRVEW